jgi:hypothetical protein
MVASQKSDRGHVLTNCSLLPTTYYAAAGGRAPEREFRSTEWLFEMNLVRSRGDDNQNEVGGSQKASCKELSPILPGLPQLQESGHATDDEQEVGNAARQDH